MFVWKDLFPMHRIYVNLVIIDARFNCTVSRLVYITDDFFLIGILILVIYHDITIKIIR